MRAEEKETGRLEAFSDGVFAIAMTLLALDLKVPHLSDQASAAGLGGALVQQWPSYVAFVTSFGTVLVMWVHHHGMFRLIHKVTSGFLFVNGFLLLLVTVVPFPTALVSAYFGKPGGVTACAVYAGLFVMISVAYNLLWRMAAHKGRLLRSDAPELVVRTLTSSYLMGIPLYLLATMSAFYNEYVSLGICSALWIFWAVITRNK